jgi:divalent metal cation (Fe/Co/Zn/Cd) transporter
VIYVGIRLSSRKTRSFPLGLYKLENVASVLIAFFIFLAGYEIIRQVLSPAGPPPYIPLTYIILLAAGTAAILFFGQYALSIGRKTESPTLIAEGRHRQVDVFSSVVVLISVTLSYFELPLTVLGVNRMGTALRRDEGAP